MNKQIPSAVRAISCLILSLAMILTSALVPSGTVNAVNDTTKLDSGKEVLAADNQTPPEMEQLPDNVYDVDRGQSFLLSEQNELAVILTGKNNDAQMHFFDNINMDPVSSISQYDTETNGINISNAEHSVMNGNGMNWFDQDKKWVQSIGVDWNGNGRKDHIASIGYTFDTNNQAVISLSILNASTGSYPVKSVNLGISDLTESGHEWVMDNYIAITAGDYDGDGRETLIAYVPGKTENSDQKAGLIEIIPVNNSYGCTSKPVLEMSSVLKNKEYLSSSDYKYRPVVGLATGDFNGDGHDQLAYSAGFYNTSGNASTGYRDYKCNDLDQFAACVGVIDCSSQHEWHSNTPLYMWDKGSMSEMSGSEKTYPLTIMHAGQIAAGDVDNNGIDEIVAAGYMSLSEDEDSKNYARAIYTNGNLTKVSDVCNWSEMLVSSVICYNGNGYTRTSLTPFEMPAMQKATFLKCCETDWAFTKLAMACGKTNGNNANEDVFIAGYLYSFKDYIPAKKYRPYWFTDASQMVSGMGDGTESSVNWVRNVTTGNFNGNNAGREQFVFTFWQKVSGKKAYSAIIGSVTGAEFDDKLDGDENVKCYGPPTLYATGMDLAGAGWGPHYIYENGQRNCQLFANTRADNALYGMPVAVDIDDDGLLGKFSKSGYVYTDPEVLAVLEAGPYFREIDEAGGYEDPCQTSYSISSGYSTATARTDKYAFEVGIAAEASGPGVKASLEGGYSQDWSRSFEESYSITSTTRFVAQSQSIVVIHRIPHIIYTYDIWDAENDKWLEDGYNVRVPLPPRYFMLSISEYNKFVDSYNALLEQGNELPADKISEYKLNKIIEGVDIPEGYEGNPDRYWNNLIQAGEGRKQLSRSSYGLGHSSGNQGCEYTTEAAATESEEISHGVHFGLTLQGGGDYVVGEAWAGAYTNVDYSSSTGHSTTTVDTKSSGGQVQNIKASNLDGNNSKIISDSYKFKWEFIKWTRKLAGGDSPAVPFYGYTVSEVKRLPLPVKLNDVSATVDEGYTAFTIPVEMPDLAPGLEVSKISGDEKITYDSGAKCIKVDAGLTGGKYEPVFSVTNGIEKLDKKFRLILQVNGNSDKQNTTDKQNTDIEKGKTYKKSGQTYKTTSLPSGNKAGTVTFTKSSNSLNVKVPDTVKLADGKIYKVTVIAAKAFTGAKVRTVTIGKNVRTIKKYAFKGSKATKLIVKSKNLTGKSVAGSLKGSKIKSVQVKVGKKSLNKRYVKKYKKIFTKKNAGRKVTVR